MFGSFSQFINKFLGGWGSKSKRPHIPQMRTIEERKRDRLVAQKMASYAAITFLFFFAIVVVRLWIIQVRDYGYYCQEARRRRTKVIRLKPPRGKILDRYGRVIAGDRPRFNICLLRQDAIGHVPEILNCLSKWTGVPEYQLKANLLQSRDVPVYKPVVLLGDIDWKTLAVVEARLFKLPGVSIEVESQRRYPLGSLAPHLIGYLREASLSDLRKYKGLAIDDLVGKRGVERRFQNILAGRAGKKIVEVNAVNRLIKVKKIIPPVPGDDIYLTIDADIQMAAQNAMKGKVGAVVALDPRNGQILAFYSSPGIDLNSIDKNIVKLLHDRTSAPLMDRVVQGRYPPGSIFKIVVAAAGLQTGVITPSTIFYCPGYMRLGRRIFRCWDIYGHGKVDLYKGIVQSCDVYFYRLGLKLGPDKIAKYAHMFGLGQRTGIALRGEVRGLIPTPKWKLRYWQSPWQGGDTVNMAIGQGFVLVSPIQAAHMISAVANKQGELFRPQYVLAIKDWKGDTVESFKPDLQSRLDVKKRYLDDIRRALRGVVESKHGTGWRCRIDGLEIAGKTGTAQVIEQNRHTKEKKLKWRYRDLAWFVAYAPFKNPKIALAVLVVHGGHGGSAAVPVARKIFECWLNLQRPRPKIQAPVMAYIMTRKKKLAD